MAEIIPKYKPFPILFIGHGNPMNAILTTPFTQSLTRLGKELPTPKAIVCISAHWMTEGSWITHMEQPKTIHDFYGFPEELFKIQYLAPGHPQIAQEISDHVLTSKIYPDNEMWGLDHGTWSVLRHMYPEAKIPVLQLSLDMEQPPAYHFKLGQQLKAFREKDILIIGSGNVVHNLKQMKWEANAKPYEWAQEFDSWLKTKLEEKDYYSILHKARSTPAGKLSIPSLEHWLPLLYILGAADMHDTLKFEWEGIENASISMRCLSLGR